MTKLLLPLALLLLSVGTASASDARRARDVLGWLDRNGDRLIQASEIEAVRAALFDRLDANGNGYLEAEETQAALDRAASRRRRMSAFAADLAMQVTRMDLDNDHRISREEFSRFTPDRITRADSDGDGVLSLRELKALRVPSTR